MTAYRERVYERAEQRPAARTEPHYETLELRVPEEERRYANPTELAVAGCHTDCLPGNHTPCYPDADTCHRWAAAHPHRHEAYRAARPSRRWIYLAVLFVALLIVVIAQLASAPSGASEPPSTAPALRGAPHVLRQPEAARKVAWGPAGAAPHFAATRLHGYASWYDVASGHAAAGPLLRTGDWRGRAVTVCAGSACIVTRLTDWCACGSRHGIPTLIDLARSDFARLAPPSSGIVLVTVSGATLPATDMEAQP